MMSRLWKTLGPVKFKELNDNMWLFEFTFEFDKRPVLDGRPWLFDRCVLVLKEMDDNIPPLHMDFNHALFWVHVHDMPFLCMTREVGLRIGALLGKVVDVDVTGDDVGWGRSLRIRIHLPLSSPLERGRSLHHDGKLFGFPFVKKSSSILLYVWENCPWILYLFKEIGFSLKW
jgi:hypothetical protein